MIVRTVQPPISILTVSKRDTSIDRCVSSVTKQDYNGGIEHIILVDGTQDVFCAWRRLGKKVSMSIHNMERSAGDRDGPTRLAFLRNRAVEMARNEYVVFLDDDNAWSPNHLSSLWSALISGDYYMAHSYRLIYEQDGKPYLRPEFPWKRDREERERIYRLHAELGIVTPGSNLVRDYVGMPFSCVDLGEWLLRREFLVPYPFAYSYSDEDWWNIIVEDNKLQKAIIESNIPTVCTHFPTLHYFLGGYSNCFSERASIYWQPPNT